MTCRQCRDLMLEVARRRAAPFVDRRSARTRRECGDCSRRLERERQLTARRSGRRRSRPTLRPRRRRIRGPSRWPRSSAHAPRAKRTAGPARTTVARVGWLLAAAVLVCSPARWHGWSGGPPAPPTRHRGSSERLVSTAGAATSGGDLPCPASRARGRRRTPVRAPTARAARATRRRAGRCAPWRRRFRRPASCRFLRRPGLPDFESGEIVRLGIPVTALPNYGIEIPAGAQSAIQADLLIGQDGQARAIRLVDASAHGEGQRPRQ